MPFLRKIALLGITNECSEIETMNLVKVVNNDKSEGTQK